MPPPPHPRDNGHDDDGQVSLMRSQMGQLSDQSAGDAPTRGHVMHMDTWTRYVHAWTH